MSRVAVIQARMGSSRLPGKALLELGGEPVVERVYRRVERIEGLDRAVVATTTEAADEPLVAHCRAVGIPVHRGSESDVLDRYYRVADELGATVVMRITADCPLLDPRESARVLAAFLDAPGCGYASNVEPPFLPDGMDTEVMSFAALERMWREARAPEEREHVTLHARRHPQRFSAVALRDPRDRSDYRLTLDTPADYRRLQEVVAILERRGQYGWVDEAVAVLDELARAGD